ncbi:hypothetical protein V6N13_049430 [Hibiscus sabdariffa]|uniref:Uncharacterized protein n=1 Tax=Hibiscus sabdariffa TaxID=183260 RepID=A0ABR2QX80_9ROSI
MSSQDSMVTLEKVVIGKIAGLVIFTTIIILISKLCDQSKEKGKDEGNKETEKARELASILILSSARFLLPETTS